MVAADDGETPSERTVLAVGEAKAGEMMTQSHLQHLIDSGDALGERAAGAKLLLFGVEFSAELRSAAKARADVELIDLDRLYHGE